MSGKARLRLEGKVALLMGAGSVGDGWGNGKATAALMAREGASVFCVDLHLEAAQVTRDVIRAEGGTAEAHRADVGKAQDIEAAARSCMERFGRIDVLVNNVGISALGGVVEQTEEDWDRVMDVNVKAMFLACKAAIPRMLDQGGGAIVNISSIASERWLGVPYVSYAVSKAAVNQLTRVTALQYAARGIRVNTVLPGLINSPHIVEPLRKVYEDVDTMIATRDRISPTGKMGDAWDVAHAALFLASDDAKYINGSELFVDGGLHCQVAAPAVA